MHVRALGFKTFMRRLSTTKLPMVTDVATGQDVLRMKKESFPEVRASEESVSVVEQCCFIGLLHSLLWPSDDEI